MTTDMEQRQVRLTAYALGELEPAERKLVEAELADDQDARAFVDEVMRSASTLQVELGGEPEPAPDPRLRRAVETRLHEKRSHKDKRTALRRRLIWMPTSIIVTALLVVIAAYAALFVITMMVDQAEPTEQQLLSSGQAVIGMSKAEVTAKLGQPDATATATFTHGFGPQEKLGDKLKVGQTYETWTYKHGKLELYVWFAAPDDTTQDPAAWRAIDVGTHEEGRVY
jgi:hypothetical protein